MAGFPQSGGCLCNDVRYRLLEDPVTVYVCHCTDCQRQTGSSFALSMIVREAALELTRGELQRYAVEMPDGRFKRSTYCGRCASRLWGISSTQGLLVLEPGTLDDTSWFRPVGHIWTRSAQPWVEIPEHGLRFATQPTGEEQLDLVRAWKRSGATGADLEAGG